MNTNNSEQNCCCSKEEKKPIVERKVKKWQPAFKIFRSTFLSLLIAFFPKCPVCWAVYMSMFGSLGISQLPYMKWLLPVLIAFLGLHLFMQFKGIKRHGYLPFTLSVIGATILLISRSFFPTYNGILILGMVFIISGSLINSLSDISIQFLKQKNTNT